MTNRITEAGTTVWNRIRHPIQTVRNNLSQGASEWRAHPFQEAIQRLVGVGTGIATANPLAGRAAGSGMDHFFSWLNNRGNNNNGPGSGLPGIAGQNQQGQSSLQQFLGMPDYSSGSSWTGDPQQTNGQGEYGPPSSLAQGRQQPRFGTGGSSPMPTNNAANITGGGARDHFMGTNGAADMTTAMRSMADLGSQGGGLDRNRNEDVGKQALRRNIRAMLQANPNDQHALELRRQMIENRGNGQ